MQPLKPQDKDLILKGNPAVTPDEINEYESLLAARFAVNPMLQKSPQQRLAENARRARLNQLKEKLFAGHAASAGI